MLLVWQPACKKPALVISHYSSGDGSRASTNYRKEEHLNH